MVKALIITWACLGLFTGCGGKSQKSKASEAVATLDPDLNLSIPDKNNQVDLSIPSISDQSPQEAPDLKLPDLLMVDHKGSGDLKGSGEIAADPVIVSANKKAPPSPVPWPKEVGPQGSGAAAPLTSEESAGQVKNRLDSLALSAEKKVEDAKVDPNDSWQKLVDVIAESGGSVIKHQGTDINQQMADKKWLDLKEMWIKKLVK